MEDIAAPPEVKEQIQQRMKDSKVISDMEKRVLDALNVAAKEIVNNVPIEKSALLHDPFKNETEYTVMALSAIVKFLEEKGYNFALKALIAETNFKNADKYEAPNIKDILDNLMEQEEEENFEVVDDQDEQNDEDDHQQEIDDDSEQDLSIDLSDENSDEEIPKAKPQPKVEEKPVEKKPEPTPAFFQQFNQRKIPPAQNIKKIDFDSNSYIVSVKDL
ncbi:hypothetical protein TVAG_049670 [Trichomonas vaginalis G3]|uniref:Uncharacterized protein n=1 Tax=Trichomonas vaginalis (strain ATCC PRA-98 / G3) TaxID=412133 RepID=A2EVW2_TRIV3|nr:hypothetical protein TVAGG3_0548200 [Trichomonas vaginalis G3]EAY03183.1 hypothetical protein TVAG_049670 [Trichomonas vaginalis G3]KAI5520324.1 hypothetical protein TVAGG3_0548200 [Trichomonas vaginalis G3]|eukprot:XP_001315406.1 hypothetical protein [Trichomonas vaginalis G3]